MALTAKAVANLAPRDKLYRVSDEVKGLVLEVAPNGSKRWRYRFSQGGKPTMISLGVYPEITLAKARNLALDARKRLVDGEEPKGVRAKRAALAKDESLFGLIDEWISIQKGKEPATLEGYRRYRDSIGKLGEISPAKVTPMMLVELCQRISNEVSPNRAHRVLTFLGQVMRYGIPSGRVLADPTIGVRAGIPAKDEVVHRHAITTPAELPELLAWIDEYEGSLTVRCFLQLVALWWCRVSELTEARWEDIDWEQKLYRIPAERMKMKREHLVPISRQAEELLLRLREATGSSEFIFPAMGRKGRPMNRTSPTRALRSVFRGKMTVHGFRSTASTLLNERGWNPDVIEAQLAHQDANAVRRAYNRAQYLEDRRRMMQEWADYLDELRAKN